MARRRQLTVLVPLEHNPLELWLLTVCLVSGVVGFVNGPLDDGIPAWARLLWYVLLFAGGAVYFVGVCVRDVITSTLIVRAALIPVGFGAYLWAVPAAMLGGLLGGVLVAAFGVAAHWRAVQLTNYLWRTKVPL